jgi:hypothetical protein
MLENVNAWKWERPSHRWLNCNVDAAFFVSDVSCGLVVMAQTHWKVVMMSIIEGKATILLEAI